MLTYVLRRVLLAIPVLIVSSVLVFMIVRATTDPTARLSLIRDPTVVERETKRLGLDQPLPQQYLTFATGFVQGDWGQSFVSRRSVGEEIRGRLWNTVQLILWAIAFSSIVAIAVGVYSAAKQYSALDYTFTSMSFVGLAMPSFFFGLLAIDLLVFRPKGWFNLDDPLLYSVGIRSAAGGGFGDYLRHLVLPVLTLSVQLVAGWSRYQRSSMLDVMNADYIRTARAKGVSRGRVLIKHGLRNALIPLTTVMAIDIGLLFGGLIVTETIFGWPGMGQLFVNALLQGDTNILLPWLMVSAMFVLLFNLMADLLYGVLDPRIRLT